MTEMAPEAGRDDGCRICRTPARDQAFYCDGCRDLFDQALGDTTWLDEELDITITRQKGVNLNGGGSKSAETPIPWHDKAAEARRDLHGILVAWVKFCTDENVRGRPTTWFPRPAERPTLPSLARWLLHCTHGLSLLEIGVEAHDEITTAVDECRRIVFWKRRNRVYLGPCNQPVKDEDGEVVTLTCPGDVYAEEGDPTGACGDCAQGVTVVIRQSELNAKLDSRLCTAAELARICVFLGLDAPRDKVRKKVHYWHRNRRISSHGSDPAGDPMFRYGEVRTMLYTEFAEKVKG